MRLLIPFLFFFFLLPLYLPAQYLTGIETKWSDSFAEWTIFTDDEELEGELKMRWALQNDWTEWDYRIGDVTGRIKVKWKDNPNEWEVRGENKVVTCRTVWNNNFREWRITDNTNRVTLKTKFGNLNDEWILRNSDKGTFEMFSEWEGLHERHSRT